MRRNITKKTTYVIELIILLGITTILPGQESRNKQSSVGIYQGYTTEKYTAFERSSRYLTMRDGVRLAMDIYRPTANGKMEKKPLPVIWMHTRYSRALKGPRGNVMSIVNSPIGMTFIKNGYVLVIVDARGTGASFGIQPGIFAEEPTQDAYEITEWIANQKWCNQKIGMMGGSYEAITQLMAASTCPPHLKAIFPAMGLLDLYALAYHGGIYFNDLIESNTRMLQKSIKRNVNFIAPVDDDTDRKWLLQAHQLRKMNRTLAEIFPELPYWDSYDPHTKTHPYLNWGPFYRMDRINASGVAVYVYGGWFDLFPKDALILYSNLKTPKKLLMIDSPHSSGKPFTLQIYLTEQLRWFDYWLKGIDNGIMEEPPIHLQKISEHSVDKLLPANTWPLPNITPFKTYLHAGPSGSVASVNDGILDIKTPEPATGKDRYTIDYTTSSGTTTRWDDASIKQFGYPDMTANDIKGLTYTTRSPLDRNLTICGHPKIHLWIESSAPDCDVFVYLEDVDSDSMSRYITEGCLRASHRKTIKPPLDYLGLPYHSNRKEDVADMESGQPTLLTFDLLPTYYEFKKGHKIRLTITGADRDNALTPKIDPPPVLTIHRNQSHTSFIELPLLSEQ